MFYYNNWNGRGFQGAPFIDYEAEIQYHEKVLPIVGRALFINNMWWAFDRVSCFGETLCCGFFGGFSMENSQFDPINRPNVARFQQLVPLKSLCARLRISRPTAYRRQNPRSQYYDPDFPEKICLGGRTVRYAVADIDNYLKCKTKKEM